MSQPDKPVLVLGAGIAGITTALETAEIGAEVVLVEREPFIGGRVSRLHLYFPKMCPPPCGLEINVQRLERQPRLRVLASTRLVAAERQARGWKVELETAPQWIDASCTCCGECTKACTSKVPDPFNLDLAQAPAVRLPHPGAWPRRYILDREACTPEELERIRQSCPVGAVKLDARPVRQTLEVSAIVLATGWQPYPLERLTELGGGKLADVVSNVQLERLCSPTGPSAGKILRFSDGQPPATVAFVQCAGSRDVNHLPYCSGVCCLASLKQALYIKEQLPQCEVSIFYIDRRTPGRNEDMLQKVAAQQGVRLIKGKVGRIEQREGKLLLHAEDVEAGRLLEQPADMVVLATGMMPNLAADKLPLPLRLDDDGFGLEDPAAALFVAGVARRPEDVAASVRDSTGAAGKALAAGRRA